MVSDLRLKQFRLENIVPMIKEGNLVLDIGSEKGEIIESLSKNHQVISSDIDKSALKSLDGMRVCLDGNKKLPFKDNSIEIITAFEIVEHLHNFLKFFEETYRILKPGSQMFITTPNFLNVKHRVQMMRGNLPHFKPNYHISPFTFDNLSHYLKNAGFTIKEERAITKNRFHKRVKSLGGGIFVIAEKPKK